MKTEIKSLLKNWRIWVLIFFVLTSILAINYDFTKNNKVIISGVYLGSSAAQSGISYDSSTSTSNLEVIKYINKQKIHNITQYYKVIENLNLTNYTTITIITDKNPQGYQLTINDSNLNTTNQNKLGFGVREKPSSNIKLGIELEGGSRIILKTKENVSSQDFELIIKNLENRLDLYGASGTKVSKIEDTFTNKKFIMVESSSSNKEEIFELISQQGHFSAKFGNTTVYTGDDILRIFNDAQHSRFKNCNQNNDNLFTCSYIFQVEIKSSAAQNFYEVAKSLGTTGNANNKYLTEELKFVLDNKTIIQLPVGAEFANDKVLTPSITLSGDPGKTIEEAKLNTKKEADMIKAVLGTETLPTELEVVESYSISSSLGDELLDNSIFIGILAVLAVASLVALRYRNWIIFFGVMITLITEVTVVIGMSAFMNISINLAAIGGLIAAIGSGVDDQIIITDEYFRKSNKKLQRKKKIKKAFTIILLSFATTIAAMIPLALMGLKLLQGFAVMIILGVTVGVLITRPAYGAIIQTFIGTKTQKEEIKKNKK